MIELQPGISQLWLHTGKALCRATHCRSTRPELHRQACSEPLPVCLGPSCAAAPEGGGENRCQPRHVPLWQAPALRCQRDHSAAAAGAPRPRGLCRAQGAAGACSQRAPAVRLSSCSQPTLLERARAGPQAMVNDPEPVFKRLQDETNDGQPLTVLNDAARARPRAMLLD